MSEIELTEKQYLECKKLIADWKLGRGDSPGGRALRLIMEAIAAYEASHPTE